ncbi:MAG: carbohydrate kinase, partial [Planctomycetes bacterium]|nr:carbohydrate kinase [Planctomycetota bacterium]
MSFYLGLDFSTQSASGIVIDTVERRIVWQESLNYSSCFSHYGTRDGVHHGPDGEVSSPPLMWVEALDALLLKLKASPIDVSSIRAICGSGQQHGTVYLNASFAGAMAGLDPSKALHEQLKEVFSRQASPIWMDTSTQAECEELEQAAQKLGGMDCLTGSRATLRFSGPQIRKFYKRDPAGYEATRTIHLVSSFICTLMLGRNAPIDFGDGSGMNVMDLSTRRYHAELLQATAPGLDRKLTDLAACQTLVGTISPFMRDRFGFSPETKIAVFSGDNPCSLVGLGLSSSSEAAISLGTSDTYFGLDDSYRISPLGDGHVFVSPTGENMSLICFMNGSLAREAVRSAYELDWPGFEASLSRTPPCNRGRLL